MPGPNFVPMPPLMCEPWYVCVYACMYVHLYVDLIVYNTHGHTECMYINIEIINHALTIQTQICY